MKKLLCVLMFGMMFGQMKVETRLYTDINFFYNTNINLFNLLDLSDENNNLDYINVQIVNFNINYSNTTSGSSFCIMELYTSTPSAGNGHIAKIRVYPNDSYSFYDFSSNSFPVKKGVSLAFNFDGGNPGCYSTNGTFDALITAEFPQEETGYIEDGFDYCLHTGANLVSSPCRDEVAIESAIPSDILQNITGIITEGGAASNLGGNWVGSLNGLGGGKGYWVISDIDGCFNYTCSEN